MFRSFMQLALQYNNVSHLVEIRWGLPPRRQQQPAAGPS
jgi:hypothetical protein